MTSQITSVFVRLSKQGSIYTIGGFIFPKTGAPWTRRLDRQLQRIIEAGLVAHYFRRYLSSKALDLLSGGTSTSGENRMDPKPQSLSVTQVLGMFGFLAVMLVFSFASFAVEVAKKKKKKKRK